MAIYGGNWANASSIALGGNAHIIHMGDSVHFGGRNYTPAHFSNLQVVYPDSRWNYMVAGGLGATDATLKTNYWRMDGYNNVTQTTYGITTADAQTPNGPKLIRPVRSGLFASDIADNTVISSNTTGIQINRAYTDTPNATLRYLWPYTRETGKPWYFDSGAGDGYMKGKLLVAGRSSAGVLSIDTFLKRWSSTGGVSNETTPETQTFSAAASIQATPFTPVLADAGNYTASGGYLSTDRQNDHAVQLGLRTTAGYNELNLNLDIVGAVFARCNSGGTIGTNANGASCGYDAFGRSGSSIGDWANTYAGQTQWSEYFTATVLNPTAVTVMDIEIGRNVTPVTEQTGGAVNATWSTYYLAFIDILRSAYSDAFASGTLHINLIVPPLCTGETNFMQTTTAADSLQSAVEALCRQRSNLGWASYYEYFSKAAPLATLHPSSYADGNTLSTALRSMKWNSCNRSQLRTRTPRGRTR